MTTTHVLVNASAKNMILMIPDGTGPNVFTMARAVNDMVPLHLDPLMAGTVRTYSNSSLVTDSAAAATAYACGVKTTNKAIGVDPQGASVSTILEQAQAAGKVVGMIVTTRITHATPAAFAAHVIDRKLEDTIASQYVTSGQLDFVLGGGGRYFPSDKREALQKDGYTIVDNKMDLQTYVSQHPKNGTLRLYGLFADDQMAYAIDRPQANATRSEPSLPEMVTAILTLLSRNVQAQTHGFFLLIEGSRIDHAGHANDPGAMVHEALEFDATVGLVKTFVTTSPTTALLSVADHGTGGLTLGKDGVYAWNPSILAQATVSTAVMVQTAMAMALTCPPLTTRSATLGRLPLFPSSQTRCHQTIVDHLTDMLAHQNGLQTLSPVRQTALQESVEQLLLLSGSEADHEVLEKKALWPLGHVLGHVQSDAANIGWTTGGHVGTDVNLYCLGPRAFEASCRGNFENTAVHDLMGQYLFETPL